MLTKSCRKVAPNYYCESCDYSTGKTSSYSKHLLTAKHNKLTNVNKKLPKSCSEIKCEKCNKLYKSRVGLWSHKKKCSLIIEKPLENTLTLTTTDITNPSFIMNLVKDNQEFKSLLMESQKIQFENQKIQIEQQKENKELVNKVIELSQEPRIVNHGNITNNNQKHFNLQFFLNETCKDAINMTDFLKSIQLQLDDLEETARLGYVDGVSRIFIRLLKDMEVNKRPIHCTDIKRETVYVKTNDNWEKDNPEKKNLKKAVEYIANKNMYQINDWKEENPNWTDNESEEGQVLNKIYMATIGGGTDEEDTKYVNKIIKNVLNEVVVDKDGE